MVNTRLKYAFFVDSCETRKEMGKVMKGVPPAAEHKIAVAADEVRGCDYTKKRDERTIATSVTMRTFVYVAVH